MQHLESPPPPEAQAASWGRGQSGGNTASYVASMRAWRVCNVAVASKAVWCLRQRDPKAPQAQASEKVGVPLRISPERPISFLRSDLCQGVDCPRSAVVQTLALFALHESLRCLHSKVAGA